MGSLFPELCVLNLLRQVHFSLAKGAPLSFASAKVVQILDTTK